MWGFTSAPLIKPDAFTKDLQWAHKDQARLGVSVWVWVWACTMDFQYSLVICCVRNTYGNLSRKTQQQQFNTKAQVAELCRQKKLCLGWKQIHNPSKAHTNLHKHTARYRLREHITEHGRDYNISPLSQIRQDQIISLLWCQFAAV